MGVGGELWMREVGVGLVLILSGNQWKIKKGQGIMGKRERQRNEEGEDGRGKEKNDKEGKKDDKHCFEFRKLFGNDNVF